MKLLSRLLPAACLVAGSLFADAAASNKWHLVWSDEFDRAGLADTNKWTYEFGFVRNEESQFYTRARNENARLENGHLVIEARKEPFKNPKVQPGRKGRRGQETADYTSASLTTKGKASWTYGRIEVRAKLPEGRGTWPAIWMLGTNHDQVGWPACGEIDIMEFVGFNPGVVHANVHMTKYNHARGTGKGDKIKAADVSSAFHIYALEWFPDRLEFYLDDQRYFTFKNEGTGKEAWPFDKPHYLILNLAIGGAWGAQKGIDDSIFPARFLVDYVRVYTEAKK